MLSESDGWPVCQSHFHLSVVFPSVSHNENLDFFGYFKVKKVISKGNKESKKGGKKEVDREETKPDTRLPKSRAGGQGQTGMDEQTDRLT